MILDRSSRELEARNCLKKLQLAMRIFGGRETPSIKINLKGKEDTFCMNTNKQTKKSPNHLR